MGIQHIKRLCNYIHVLAEYGGVIIFMCLLNMGVYLFYVLAEYGV